MIRPFLVALDASPIIEIGAASGRTTEKLLELVAGRDAVLHTIDPKPQFDVASFEERFSGHFRFYREKSHDALERIEPAAAVIIDGDHNWYTVHGELVRLERIANSGNRPFPLVMFHDVEWPYARRDMYYDPDAIPEEWRKPWDRRGIRWGNHLLDETGKGLNSSLANALEEGGPRNGVLTAIEDFLEECQVPLELRIVHGPAGLGVLVSNDLLSANPAVRREWDRLHSTEFLLEHAQNLAEAAVRTTVAYMDASHEAESLRRKLEESERGGSAVPPLWSS